MHRLVLVLFAALLVATTAAAQTDEIQVYDGGLAAPGVFNLTLHNNYIASGPKEPAFPDAVAADGSFNGVPEWAVGVTRWLEVGLYLPVYSHDQSLGWVIDGVKPRALVAVPNADARRFFYGVNFEFSINGEHWDQKRFTSEVRPIVGWHVHAFDFVINPIVDTSYDGLGNLDFAPSTRIAYKATPRLSLAAEEYADFGPVSDFYSPSNQAHQLFAVVDYGARWGLDVEAGVGFGLTDATEGLTVKLILAHDLTSHAPSHGAERRGPSAAVGGTASPAGLRR